MTTIAWDGKSIAADRQATFQGTVSTCAKLFRIGPNQAAAVCGWAAHIAPLIDWAKRGCPSADHPAHAILADRENGSMLIIADSDGVKQYSTSSWPRLIEDKIDAWGCGMDFALGAMHAGATAKQSVEIACRLNSGSGQGVDVINIKVKRARGS